MQGTSVEVNGVKLRAADIPQIIAMMANPDHTNWYRFVRCMQEDPEFCVQERFEYVDAGRDAGRSYITVYRHDQHYVQLV